MGLGSGERVMGINSNSLWIFSLQSFQLLQFLDEMISEMYTKLLDNKITLQSRLSRKVGVGSGEWGVGSGRGNWVAKIRK